MSEALADIGIFGGSGLYRFLDDVEERHIETPYGPPAAPVAIGAVEDRRVAFLPRHGTGHQHPPHRVPYRANVSAMRQLGVRALLAPCAAGSLQPTIHPGHVVVLDQMVDRTWGRAETFHDSFDDGPVHTSLADPYDPELRARLVNAARAQGLVVHDGGTVVVVNGPRFSTRAESSAYRQAGWDVINMTQHPEAALAREAGIPFAGIALVTDHDAGLDGIEGIEPVSQEQVFTVFEANLAVLRSLLLAVVAQI